MELMDVTELMDKMDEMVWMGMMDKQLSDPLVPLDKVLLVQLDSQDRVLLDQLDREGNQDFLRKFLVLSDYPVLLVLTAQKAST